MLNPLAQTPTPSTFPTPMLAAHRRVRSTDGETGSQANASPLNTALGDKENLTVLGLKLAEIAATLGESATAEAVLAALTKTGMPIHADSSYPTAAGTQVDLATFIRNLGLPLPTDHFSLSGLGKAVTHRGMEHPLGNLGGALSWPVPLSADEQRRLQEGAQKDAAAGGGKGILERLYHPLSLSADTLSDPAKLLDTLLASPQAQMLGKHLQVYMQGAINESSHTDYLLAAINLELDPESMTNPDRNKVAGFDLAGSALIGQPPTTLLRQLGDHLVSQGKTSPKMAQAAVKLLLASRAPAFLVKNIPQNVTYGSLAWVNLAIAAATIEAQTPGKVANMTYTQVMLEARSAGAADPATTQRAQLEALVDWGVANGVLARKSDHLYSADELNALTEQFNTRKQQMAVASAALDTELPSRKELALAKLKERFGDLGPLFEEKLIDIKRRVRGLDDGKGYNSDASNPHSMLDVAMMELADRDVEYFSKDRRIPIAALNANRKFDVVAPFNRQFDQAISDKKAAIATYIKQLVAQLPVEDRQHLEQGKLQLFQTSSYTQGTGVSSRVNHPKNEKLLIKTEHNGATRAYEIDFNQGRIKQTHPWRVGEKKTKVAHDVTVTKSYKPAGSESLRQANPSSSSAPPDSFSSTRTQVLADAFVQHLELDNPAIKAQAQGLTTLDKHVKKIEAVSEFALNLVPFRSAIVNFQKGNYAEGALDLALDVFGFLTSGAGAASKVLKIAGSGLSTANKVLQAAKVIGSATVSALNPLSGLGDALVGGSRFAAKGLKFLTSKGIEYVNSLRGATGSYDLLKALSKEHGPTLIGTYKVGDVETQGLAALRNDQWFKYDPALNKLYGPPIADFSPRGAPELRTTLNGAAERESVKLHNNLIQARTGANRSAFDAGYANGRLQSLPGYQPGMGSKQLRALAVADNRRPEEMGILARELKNEYLEDATYISSLLTQDVAGPGVKITPSSQIHYNAKVDLPSIGECAGMSYAMALAIHTGKEDQFLKNMLKVADGPKTPGADKFINDLRNLQAKVQNPASFHYGVQPVDVGYQDIISKLAAFQTSTTVRIGTRDHAMLAGVRVESGKKEWFFYDPNAGLVKFNNSMAMQEGMEKLLNSGTLAATNNTLKSPTGARKYTVSTFEPSDVNRAGIDANAVADLSDITL
ncbi:hypothetical protein NUV89_07820 [Pseudomonas sp. 18.1.10]|uniref:hypothetical protein n=1 Tax=Pseudomonas sp. 18.1.10 TaxID=2969302 RepID=UPI0021500FEB|nr:hypothetical protein [Pseudomonas sp. 18.1.10]MCR4538297.1 hypothetical protein [Pseudomonas sp. 18.1.10]